MYPRPIQKLIDLFTRFPGIGPKQAARIAFFVVKDNNGFLKELIDTLQEVDKKIGYCKECFRTIEKETDSAGICPFCRDPKREQRMIAVIEKESDMQGMEKTGVYRGLYHVLGGAISPLDSESPKRLRLKELYERIARILGKEKKAELVLATNPTTEGDTTALYIERIFQPLKQKYPQFKISRLGRGLSLGSELEYADEITLKSALANRK